MRKSRLSYTRLVREFYFLIAISTFFACSQNRPDQHEALSKENTPKPPVTITAKAPFVTLLDTCPSPSTIVIPPKKSDSYIIKTENGSKTIRLLPPEIISADYLVLMQTFTTKDGLTNNNVQRGYIDKKGNLWFPTWGGGVSRYDGKSFTNYTNVQGLVSDKVWSIYEDKAGNMWFGTDGGGASRYDGKSFSSYARTQGLAGNTVWSIIEDKKGKLWFGTWDRGLFCLNHDGSFTNYTTAEGLAGDHISSVVKDINGNLWIGTWDSGVSCYDGTTFHKYTVDDGLANNTVGSILEDKDGNLWFGSGRGRISWLRSEKNLPGKKLNFMNYTLAAGLGDVHNIAEDKNGNLWFGTYGGAFRLRRDKKLNPDKESFIRITTRQGLPKNNVNGVLEDKSGNMWFCTDGGGVSLVHQDSKFLTSLTINNAMIYSGISSVRNDKAGNIWIGTLGEGALRLSADNKTLTRYTTSQGLPANEILDIHQDRKDNVWISTFRGICCLRSDGKSVTRFTTVQGFPENYILKIFEDKQGNLWFVSAIGGAYRFSPDTKSIIRYTTDQGLPDNALNNILEDKKGNFWFGGERGLSRLDPDGKSFTIYTTRAGLLSNNITSILQDKSGNLWIGTRDGGVSRYDGNSFANFTTTQGLSNNRVTDVVTDKTGTIWMGTDKGFTILKGFAQDTKVTLNLSTQKNLQPSNDLSNSELERNNFKPMFEIYNKKTGYPIDEINTNLLATREGIIWAGTSSHERIIRFDYNSMHKNPNPPDVFIQSIKINNEVISWYDLSYKEKTDSFTKTPNGIEEVTQFGKILDEDQRKAMRKKFSAIKFDSISRFYPVPANLVLPYVHNNITFDFTAIEPAKPGSVRYQYMMEGYEKEWSPVTEKSSATYGNMRQGSYTFKVKAQSPDGVWSNPVIYTFKVLPPWYRTWWSILCAVCCLVTLLYLVIRWRLRQKFHQQLQRSEKEKQFAELQHKSAELEMQALRAQMNPHFIFNSLNSVNMFILENNKSQASEYLSKFSRLVRMILHHSQESIIPLDRELEALGLYLELESLRFEKRFDYKISVKDVDTIMAKVPPLIIQPYAENAIWHGLMQKKEKGHLEIEIYVEEKILNCKITDDGIGRERAAELKSKSSLPYKSMGMRITADRLAMLQQQENIQTSIFVKDLVYPDGSAAGTEVLIKLPLHYD